MLNSQKMIQLNSSDSKSDVINPRALAVSMAFSLQFDVRLAFRRERISLSVRLYECTETGGIRNEQRPYMYVTYDMSTFWMMAMVQKSSRWALFYVEKLIAWGGSLQSAYRNESNQFSNWGDYYRKIGFICHFDEPKWAYIHGNSSRPTCYYSTGSHICRT